MREPLIRNACIFAEQTINNITHSFAFEKKIQMREEKKKKKKIELYCFSNTEQYLIVLLLLFYI